MNAPRLQMSDSDRREMAKHHRPDCVCVWCRSSRRTIKPAVKPPSSHPLTDAITLAHAIDTSGATRRETAYFDHACRMERERDEAQEGLRDLIENAGDCLEVEAPSSLFRARAILK